MYLGLLGLIRGLFASKTPRKIQGHAVNSKGDEHFYSRGKITERGPCPGLNALANQGYLPRDGKNITLPQVEEALMTALHMEKALTSAITRPLKPLRHQNGTFDLVDMRRHNIIEHDASFTRLDSRQGDNYNFQPHMFQAMLDDADGGPVTIRSLAKTYIRRNKESRVGGGSSLSITLWFVNLLQSVSLMNTAQTGGRLSRGLMTTFYTEERFPDEMLEKGKTRTLTGLVFYAVQLLFFVVFDSCIVSGSGQRAIV